jgi:phosphoribosylformylglycinamidine (FGAM) synthase-like enzyme
MADAVTAGGRGARLDALALRERRQLDRVHDDHLLNGWHIHVRCNLVVEEVREKRRPVAEVDVCRKETGGGAEGADAEISDEGGRPRYAAREETEGAVVTVPEDVASVMARDLEE